MTDQSPEASGAEDQAPEAADDCATCITGRGILLALGFAAFAAFVAADFATGGRLTAAVAGTVAALRGRAEGGQR
jgi:hypothetical protein